jgi:hypothetical protein
MPKSNLNGVSMTVRMVTHTKKPKSNMQLKVQKGLGVTTGLRAGQHDDFISASYIKSLGEKDG